MDNNDTKDSFSFGGYEPAWPEWFHQYVKEGKVEINFDYDECGFYEEDWYYYTIDVAYLWTPDKVVRVEEGEKVVNCDTYCTSEEELEKHEE